MRELLLGPWHLKQVSDMMGRISRLKETVAPESEAAVVVSRIQNLAGDIVDTLPLIIFPAVRAWRLRW